MNFSSLNFHHNFRNLGSSFSKPSEIKALEQQKIVAFSQEACEIIDLDPKDFSSDQSETSSDFLAKIYQNNARFSNISQAYAGHQFRNFVPSLGDGRAVLLAQLHNSKNESWDLVIKGSGLTPFSRPYVQNADGRAMLRSSIREFLISEALFFLNIPTSRALCLIGSEQLIMREKLEKAAQIIRLAPSHIRFGSFEYFFYRQDFENLKILADYVKENHRELFIGERENIYANFLQNVINSTANLLAKWQAFGFCHGVMNTDNMSIHGISFDFGPFGFLDQFNPNHICNSSDFQGLYSFINQPKAAFWNLNAFAISLSSLVEMSEIKEILESYHQIFFSEYHNLMAQKLGFNSCDEEIEKFIYQTLNLLEQNQTDYSHFFANIFSENFNDQKPYSEIQSWQNWFELYETLLRSKNISLAQAKSIMECHNPHFILRNHILEQAIEKAEKNDFSEVRKLQEIMKKPFSKQSQFLEYYSLPPSWSKQIKISCSS